MSRFAVETTIKTLRQSDSPPMPDGRNDDQWRSQIGAGNILRCPGPPSPTIANEADTDETVRRRSSALSPQPLKRLRQMGAKASKPAKNSAAVPGSGTTVTDRTSKAKIVPLCPPLRCRYP